MLHAFAAAKINLTLRVLGRRADGYHRLSSLVAFADVGDRLTLVPGGDLALGVDGPGAAAIGESDDNLVIHAARALAERVPNLVTGSFRLDKRLPVASGIGGGSADAAAALRLLARANGLATDDPRVVATAEATGADVPVCLAGRMCVMEGIGEALGPGLMYERLPAVLVNPGVPVETRAVFAALGLAPGEDHRGASQPRLEGGDLVTALAASGNDLEPAARAVAPQIDTVLDALRASVGIRLARMSGSGATCFGLYADVANARRAAAALAEMQPGWWVTAGSLGAAPDDGEIS